MKRKNKFRALKDDVSDCRFYYGSLVYDKQGNPRIHDVDTDLFHTCLKNTEGQFTGLIDKNGKEIYEGDVTKNSDGLLFIIGFRNGCFTSEKIKRKGNDWIIDNGARYDPCDSILLGNIYENPELL